MKQMTEKMINVPDMWRGDVMRIEDTWLITIDPIQNAEVDKDIIIPTSQQSAVKNSEYSKYLHMQWRLRFS